MLLTKIYYYIVVWDVLEHVPNMHVHIRAVLQCNAGCCSVRFGSLRDREIKVYRLLGHKNQGDKEIIITALGQHSTSTALVRRPCKYKLY